MNLGQKRNEKDDRLDPTFDDEVLPKELEELRGRSSGATRKNGDTVGLPDFSNQLHVSSGGNFSPFFERTLELLQDKKQQTLWREWADEEPDKRHGGLTGLALSGGGIRDFVQMLHQKRAPRHLRSDGERRNSGDAATSATTANPRRPPTCQLPMIARFLLARGLSSG